MLRSIILASALVLATGTAYAQEGDAAAGEKVFKKCKVCHVPDTSTNKVGPHLGDVIGRKAGSVEDFKYSTAMKESGLTWDEATLDKYLTDPRGVVKGTKMVFAGLKKEEDRANVIAYLASLKK